MQAFRVSAESKLLSGHYPSPESLASAIPRLDQEELAAFGSLWLSEGIPQSFLAQPMLYEAMRSWLGRNLGTPPKYITLVGSARIGYSLAPRGFGNPFGPNSDLDLAIVTHQIFDELAADFEAWASDYRSGRIQPSSPREATFWPQNLKGLPGNVASGFIDPYKLPARSRYPTAARLLNLSWRLSRKLGLTSGAPRVRGASIRVYRDWDAFSRQLSRNLQVLRKSLSP